MQQRSGGGWVLGVDPIEKMAGRRRQRGRADGVCCAGWRYIFDRELRTAADPMQPYQGDTKYRVYTLRQFDGVFVRKRLSYLHKQLYILVSRIPAWYKHTLLLQQSLLIFFEIAAFKTIAVL